MMKALRLALFAALCVHIACKPKDEQKPTTTPTPPPNVAQPEKPKMPEAIAAPPDVAAPPADAEKTKSGIASKVLQKGTGDKKPEPQDTV
jgi:peptidylprolyl isomerase